MERIKSITEVKDVKQPMRGSVSGWSEYDGYAVETDRQTIHVLIDNGQSCCEQFGYLASDDDLSAFIGAELRELAVVDEALNTKRVEEVLPYGLDDGGIVFVNFVTDRGVFQLVAYNAHNGYYGHEVHILSQQLQEAIGV